MTYPGSGGSQVSRDASSKPAKVTTRKLGKFKPIIRVVTRKRGK